jgi:hypothetical protein
VLKIIAVTFFILAVYVLTGSAIDLALGDLAAAQLSASRNGHAETDQARNGHGGGGAPRNLRVLPGGAKRARTADPLLAKQVLFQLSYSPGVRVSKVTSAAAPLPAPSSGGAVIVSRSGRPATLPST